MMRTMHAIHATAVLALVACGNNKTNGADAHGGSADAPAGANTISGTVNGTGFTTVGASYWIGMPDSPTTDTVVYLFDRSVACSALTNAGWDAALTAGTQILELKMVGLTPATYPVTQNAQHIPASGESVAAYGVAAPTVTDNFSTATSIVLTSIGTKTAGQLAAGSFNLTVTGGSLTGTYDAGFCATGREP
jgi:hypothetical protein